MRIFGRETLARRGKQADICVCPHPTRGGAGGWEQERFASQRPGVHAGSEKCVDGGKEQKRKWTECLAEMFPTHQRNRVSSLPLLPGQCSASASSSSCPFGEMFFDLVEQKNNRGKHILVSPPNAFVIWHFRWSVS